ncbi:MAG: hypothetical protein JWN56_471 [Sphingobacteriales bacterium]|nr:hypothetical protein [Sphingobacteriales bacterium]
MENDTYFNYFGFASNLKKSLLEERIGGAVEEFMSARLANYGFRFNKKNKDGSARANLIISEEEDVYGVVYKLSAKYYDILCKTEPGFKLIEVQVETDTSYVKALTFLSEEITDNILPDKAYLNTILKGAREHSLPEEYQVFIKILASAD